MTTLFIQLPKPCLWHLSFPYLLNQSAAFSIPFLKIFKIYPHVPILSPLTVATRPPSESCQQPPAWYLCTCTCLDFVPCASPSAQSPNSEAAGKTFQVWSVATALELFTTSLTQYIGQHFELCPQPLLCAPTFQPVLVRAAATAQHRSGCLNNKHLFITVLEARKFNMKVPDDSVCAKSPLPAFHEMERGLQSPLGCLMRALIPFMRATPTWLDDLTGSTS